LRVSGPDPKNISDLKPFQVSSQCKNLDLHTPRPMTPTFTVFQDATAEKTGGGGESTLTLKRVNVHLIFLAFCIMKMTHCEQIVISLVKILKNPCAWVHVSRKKEFSHINTHQNTASLECVIFIIKIHRLVLPQCKKPG